MRDSLNHRLKLQAFLTAIIAGSISAVYFKLVSDSVPLFSFSQSGATIADLVYHLAITQDLWTFGQNPYSVTGQLATTSRLAGTPFETAMPVGQLPPAFFLLGPLAALAQVNLEAVGGLWVFLSVVVLAWPLIGLILQLPSVRLRALLSVIFAAPLLSVTGIHAIFLGQTALLAAGTLILLTSFASADSQRRFRLPEVTLLIWSVLTLSLKPYYLLLGAFTLLTFKRWSWLLVAGALWLLLSALITAKIGGSWPEDYGAQLLAFTSSTPPSVYGSSINPSTMISIRNAFRNFAPDQTLVSIASLFTLIGLSAVLSFLFVSDRLRSKNVTGTENPPSNSHYRLRLFTALVAATAVILLFSPQLGSYEDLLYLYLLSLPLLAQERNSYTLPSSAAILLLLFLLFNRPVHLTAEMALCLWGAKAALAGIVVHSLQQLRAVGEK